MSVRRAFVAVAVAAGALLALPSVAGAAPSGVTIHLHKTGTFYGSVFSPKPLQCVSDRAVKLFKQTGGTQNPGRDKAVSKTHSYRNHAGRYKWSDGYRPRPGNFYARLPATAACQADNSKTIHLSARPNTKITGLDYGPNGILIDFKGVGGVPPYNYRCKLDHRKYRSCPGTSKFYGNLSHGHHIFTVRAVGANGKGDRTPAKRGFRIPHRGA